jgi:hypothetical protein
MKAIKPPIEALAAFAPCYIGNVKVIGCSATFHPGGER